MPPLPRLLALVAYLAAVYVVIVALIKLDVSSVVVILLGSGLAIAGMRWWERPRLLAERRIRQGQCVRCGYDLTGNASGVCPECGRTV